MCRSTEVGRGGLGCDMCSSFKRRLARCVSKMSAYIFSIMHITYIYIYMQGHEDFGFPYCGCTFTFSGPKPQLWGLGILKCPTLNPERPKPPQSSELAAGVVQSRRDRHLGRFRMFLKPRP